MQYNELFDSLQNLIKIKPSVKNIASALEISEKALYARKDRGSEFSLTEMFAIETAFGLPHGSLLGFPNANNNIGCVELYYYPDVFGSCGEGGMVFNENAEKVQIAKSSIPNFSKSNHYSIISARGSSMFPTICDEDKLIIQHNVENQILDDTIYLFRYNDELFIKRLVKNVDQIVCISENPRFQDRIIEPKGDNFSIIGKVVGLFRSKV